MYDFSSSRALAFIALSGFCISSSQAAFNVQSSTFDWTVIQYAAGNSVDPFTDQQTGDKEGDIVGNALNPSLYKKFDNGGTPANLIDGILGYRVRMGAESNPADYTGYFFVGLDVDNDLKLDLFIGVANPAGSGGSHVVAIFDPGTGLNISPSTTSLVTTPLYSEAISATNYSWMPVTTGVAGNDPTATSNDINANGQDYFLSFALPFNQIVLALNGLGKTGVNENTAMRFVVGTSQQANALNQDLNGTTGNTTSALTYSQLGIASLPYSALGTTAIPEPSAILLLSFGLLGLGSFKLYRRGHSASPLN